MIPFRRRKNAAGSTFYSYEKGVNYSPPAYRKADFTCIHCDVHTRQYWGYLASAEIYPADKPIYNLLPDTEISVCEICNGITIWKNRHDNAKMVYPLNKKRYYPAEEGMPEDVRKLYEEANIISQISPAASKMLLRKALEKLIEHLGAKEGTLYERIELLFEKEGASHRLIKLSHAIRSAGNEGAHGDDLETIDKDGNDILEQLCYLLNSIVRETIREPEILRRITGEHKASNRRSETNYR